MANIGVNIPDGGAAGTALLSQIVTLLTGSKRTPETINAVADGNTPDNVQSMAIIFEGDGGTLDGIAVDDGFTASFTPNKGDDTVAQMPFTVPTVGTVKRVIITYVDL